MNLSKPATLDPYSAVPRPISEHTAEETLRLRRSLVYAPTACSSFLLAMCMFLPFGLYGGCHNNPPRSVAPIERQSDALAAGNFSELVLISTPYVFALAIGLATLAACFYGGRRTSAWIWTLYAGLMVPLNLLILWQLLLVFWTSAGRPLADLWRENGFTALSIFWLINVVLATWIETPSRFVAAMLLQLVVVLLIWLGLAHWLLFLDGLLIGGWITAVCAVGIPVGTVLQLYADPQASRESARQTQDDRRSISSRGTPQFTLRGILIISTLVAAVLGAGRVWDLPAAAMLAFSASISWLAVRRCRAPRHSIVAGWYCLAALLLAVGGLLALSSGS